MPPVRTDGATATPVDQPDAWDAVFAEGREFGDANPGLGADPDGGSPQSGPDGSSDGAGNGSPVAPRPAAAGDDGTGTAGRDASPDVPDPAGASPAVVAAAPATPNDTDPTADPLAGADPFTFSVGDETRTMEGVYRIPGDGVYVPEDKVPQFQLMASRAETLDRQNRDLYDRHSTLERATAWRTKDADGKEQTITGIEAAQQWRLTAARALATSFDYERALDAMVSDPSKFNLYTIVTDERGEYGAAGQQYVVPNPQGFADLKRSAQNAARESVLHMREQFPKVIAAPPPPETPIEGHAGPTIEALIKANNLTGLTDVDKKMLASQFPRYVVVTKEGRAIDPAFVEIIKDRAALRAEQAKAATTSTKTDQFNGGMNRGRQGQPVAPRQPAAPPPTLTGRNAPKVRVEPSANDMWAALVEDAKTASV